MSLQPLNSSLYWRNKTMLARSRLGRRGRSSEVQASPEPQIMVIDDSDSDDIFDDDRPVKEISISAEPDSDKKGVEFWKITDTMSCPTCNCGMDEVICFYNGGMRGCIEASSSVDEENDVVASKADQPHPAPKFIKVKKIDPIKSGFITHPDKRGGIFSISAAVSRLEELGEPIPRGTDWKERGVKMMQDSMKTFQFSNSSLKHDVESNNDNSKREPDTKQEQMLIPLLKEETTETSVEDKKDESPSPKNVVSECIRLPVRAGRSEMNSNIEAPIDENQNDRETARSRMFLDRRRRVTSLFKVDCNEATLIDDEVEMIVEESAKTPPAKAFEESDDIITRSRMFLEKMRGLTDEVDCKPGSTEDCPEDEKPPLIEMEKVMMEPSTFKDFNLSGSSRVSFISENKKAGPPNDKTVSELKDASAKKDENTHSCSAMSCDTTNSQGNATPMTDEGTSVEEEQGITKAGWISRHLRREARSERILGAQHVELLYIPIQK